MARTFIRQDTQIRNSDVYNDAVAPTEAAYETNPSHIEDDLNNLRSMVSYLKDIQAGNWFDVQTAPSTLEAGSLRGVDGLNDALHLLEKKRFLRKSISLADVAVGGSDDYVILGSGELPANTTAAVGAVATLGTVVAAHGGTFGTHALSEVAGPHALNPQNLVDVVDGASRDQILSGGRVIYGLLQGESGVTDGATITDTTTTRVQVSFVRINATGDDLEAVPAGDIQGQTVNLCFRERVRFEDLNEADLLNDAKVDVAAAVTATRQTIYDNQGTTAVDVTTNSTLDLEAAGISWTVRDDLEAMLFQIVEGSAGGTSQINIGSDVDELDIDAAVVNSLHGVSVDTGAAGTTINVGVTANQIDSGGALDILSTSADLGLVAGAELKFTDSYRAGSTWSLTDGIRLADSSAEWDAFETAFGEVSLLNAIQQASANANVSKTCANVTSTTSADTDVGGTSGGANLDAQLHDISGGTFISDHDVYLNGNLLRGGADASANNDYYPGTSLALGQLKFEFTVKINDVICVISRS